MIISKNCLFCGKEFKCNPKVYKERVFCSDKCRVQQKLKGVREDPAKKIYELYHATKSRAKYANKEFDLSLGFVEDLWKKQKGCCALSGIPFDWSKVETKKRVNKDAPSLDRIDSSKGYTKDNVRLITYHLNLALNSFGLEAFKELAKGVLR